MPWEDLFKIYGPLGALGGGFFYLLKFILEHYKEDITSRVTLAASIDGLANSINDNRRVLDDVKRVIDDLRRGGNGSQPHA